MATVLSTLYPPLVDTFMPAFPNVDQAVVHFTVSPYNSSYEIQYLHVTLVNQKTNKNAFGSDSDMETPPGTALINGVWIIPFTETINGNSNSYIDFDRDANYYTLYIPRDLLKKNEANERYFVVDCYYKVQLRFDKYIDSINGSTSLTTWNTDYLAEKRAFFSEWSSVCLLKAIPTITLHLNNFTMELDNYLKTSGTSITNLPSNLVVPVRVPQYMPGIIPFAGNLTFEGDNDSGIDNKTKTEYYKRDIKTTSNSEYIMSYRIKIFDELENLKKDSGVIYPAKAEKTNNFYWLCDLTTAEAGNYIAELTFTTNNQYTFTKTFNFVLIEPADFLNFEPTFIFNKIELPYNGQGYAWKRYDDPSLANYSTLDLDKMNKEYREDGLWYEDDNEKVLVTCEDGWVTLTVTHKEIITPGYLFIKRASSLDGFQNWELIDCSYILYSDQFSRTITDKTISSLVAYKYSVQYLTAKGNWTRTVISPEIVYPDFHDILLSRGDKQLAIRYNAQIASMTPVVNRVKIDTLGGRYPRFAENAKLHYKQFQLSGLIIAESDYNRNFMDDRYYQELDSKKYGYKNAIDIYDERMDGKYGIRNDTVKETGKLTIQTEDEEGNIETQTYINGSYSVDVLAADTSIKQQKRDTQKNTSHDLYPMNNWWWEREFREAAIEWLNDGEPKLYRSMTEGNLIVMVDSVSLTPNTQLGRRIWNFSATIYEVGDGNSLQELDALGIYPLTNEYEATFNGTYSINADTSIKKEFLGQTYSVTAKDSSSGTTLIEAKNLARPLFDLTNSKNQIMSVNGLTIGEEVGYIYQGLNENYQFNPASVTLRDLKIQFESLPQWYDLTAMTPEDTVPGSLNFIITDAEGNSSQVYVSDNGQILDVQGKGNLWDLVGLSITDFFTEWENSVGNQYYVIGQEINEETKEIENPGIYVSNNAYNTLYYKVAGDQSINGKQYIKDSFIKDNLYQRINQNDVFIGNEIDQLSRIETDDLSNYYIRQDRPATQIQLNSFQYVPSKKINTWELYRKIGEEEKYYYAENLDDLYIRIDENTYVLLNNLTYYWKVSSSGSSETQYNIKDFSKVKVYDYDWKIEDKTWDKNRENIVDFNSFINENTIYYKKETKLVEVEDENGIVKLVSKDFYSSISDISDINNCYIKYKEVYFPLNLLYDNSNEWFYEDTEKIIGDNHSDYIKINDEYFKITDITNKYILAKESISEDKEYILLEDYKDNDTDLYYWIAEDNPYALKTSQVNITQLYVNNNDEEELPDFVPIYTTTQLDTYYQTTILKDDYPKYKYYSLASMFQENSFNNPYIYVNQEYYPQSEAKKGVGISAGNNLQIVNVDSGESILEAVVESGAQATDLVVSALVRNKNTKEKNNYGLGYKLKLNLVSPYDSNVQLERTIFVNERGYYQVPSNMRVKEVTLFDGATATLDYIFEYEIKYDDVTEPNVYEAAENIAGQISGEWKWNTGIAPFISAKYWAYDKDSVTGAITQQTVDSWKAISFDGTPYTILNIQSSQDISSTQYIVGRSGVLNLQTDYPTSALYVNGKRMVQAPIARQKYLDEWEYVIDDSVYEALNYEEEVIESGGQFWYIVYNNSGVNWDDWASSDEVLPDGIPVVIYLSNDVWDETTARDIVEGWYSLEDLSSEDIKKVEKLEPMPNTVYAIANSAGGFDYKIFYLDEGWFNVEFPNWTSNKDLSIMHARVPVYGMIDYRATIIKKFWDPTI